MSHAKSNHYAVRPELTVPCVNYISKNWGTNLFNLTTHEKYANKKNEILSPPHPKRTGNVDTEQKKFS